MKIAKVAGRIFLICSPPAKDAYMVTCFLNRKWFNKIQKIKEIIKIMNICIYGVKERKR